MNPGRNFIRRIWKHDNVRLIDGPWLTGPWLIVNFVNGQHGLFVMASDVMFEVFNNTFLFLDHIVNNIANGN